MAFFLVFPTNGEGQLDSTRKRIKQDASLDQAQKKKITGITDLKIRVKTIKFSEENTKSTSNKIKIPKCGFIKIKNFCNSKATIK